MFRLGATLELRDNGFTSQVRNSVSATQSLAKTIAGVTASYFSLQGAMSVVKTAFGGATELESYRNTLNVVMKDQKKAGETLAWAAEFANKTPFETNEIVDATVKLQAYGMTAKDVLPAVGDMAGVMNKDLNQAVEAIADAQTGELERLKEFGITKQMIIDQANKTMRGKEIVNNKGQITDQQTFNKALFSLMDERFKGGMEIQAGSMKGIWSTITGVFKSSLAQMAGVSADGKIKIGGLFDTVKNKAKSLSDTLTKWSQDGTIESASQKITSAIKTVGNAISWTKQNADWLIPAIGGVAGAFIALKVISTAVGLFNAARNSTILLTYAQGGLNAVMRANPIGLVITAIGLLVAGGIALYQNWDTVKAKAEQFWLKLKEIWTNIKNLLKNPIKGVVNLFRSDNDGNGKSAVDGSHYSGLEFVPKNGYIAELHYGERVLNRKEAEQYRQGQIYNETQNINKTDNKTTKKELIIQNLNINGSNMTVDDVVNELVPRINLALANM